MNARSGQSLDLPGALRMQRARVGVTQAEAAKGLGVHEKTLGAWESGKNDIPLQKAVALCKLYGISISELVGEETVQDSSEVIKTLEGILEALRSRSENR